MKKITVIFLSFIFILSLIGCSQKKLTYYENLGYDFNQTASKNVTFRIYHSKTENHMWELLSTFTYTPTKEHFVDIRLEGTEHAVIFTLEENTVKKTETNEKYDTNDINSFHFTIEGFTGVLSGYEFFEIKNTNEEQLFRLYPISNTPFSSTYADIHLNQPYDIDEEQMDNILITLQINH